MQSMQRSIGRMIQKDPGDNAKTAVLLKDYDDAEQLLTRLVEQVGSWRAAWISLAHAQLGIVTELESLYDPIVGAADETAKPHNATPELLLERTLRLREAYDELKTDLLEEIEVVDDKVVKPVSAARDYISPVRKTIKKREKLRLDYENVQTDVTKLQRKPSRTPKDDKSLAKAEAELGPRSDAFHEVDSLLKEILPPMIAAAFNMLPPMLATLVVIQNRLLGLYYTTLHTYCEDFHSPLPPPGMENVEMWTSDHDPIKTQIEALGCVVAGRRARMTARPGGTDSTALTPTNRRPVAPAYNPSSEDDNNSGRRASSLGLIPSNSTTRPNRIPSTTAISPRPDITSKPSFSAGMATDFTTASHLGQAAAVGTSPSSALSSADTLSPAAARTNSYGGDYFGRTPSSHSSTSHNGSSSITSPLSPPSSSIATAAAAAAKKKPPPPPPAEYVVALYDYASQGSGDLSFQEGDRIKIVKKTATDQDWWQGEIGGVRGNFPANYCRPG
ncbi:uncharacterized protein B0I36DRAFT_297285 [Microdochium trichocladiopsis]|uniref:SH3 domain-containing protein n=1 Tax=Microdochium trichocladiopsis TaxID=1682393 RepID=A0A9P8XZR3_9PEZI|nr:uncharacterized protein B0I36DRAFT_297285 [Microdochium trichocladiopsis]KAH7021548.1 hypothetical protein B0I36DRAFT_297285 [Microdochium trichocladiopsis]